MRVSVMLTDEDDADALRDVAEVHYTASPASNLSIELFGAQERITRKLLLTEQGARELRHVIDSYLSRVPYDPSEGRF